MEDALRPGLLKVHPRSRRIPWVADQECRFLTSRVAFSGSGAFEGTRLIILPKGFLKSPRLGKPPVLGRQALTALRFGGLALHCFSKGGPLTTGDTVENATLEVGPGFLCLKNPLGGFDDTGDYKNQQGLRAGHDCQSPS